MVINPFIARASVKDKIWVNFVVLVVVLTLHCYYEFRNSLKVELLEKVNEAHILIILQT